MSNSMIFWEIILLLAILACMSIFITLLLRRRSKPQAAPPNIRRITLNPIPKRYNIHQVSINDNELIQCPSCKKALRPGDRFCSKCGYNFLKNCPSCKKALRPGDRFCSKCGQSLMKEIPSTFPISESTPNRMCSNCHTLLQPQDQFCGACGIHVLPNADVTQRRRNN